MAKTIFDAHKLYGALKEKFGPHRINCPNIILDRGAIIGTLDHQPLHIVFNQNGSFVIGTTTVCREVLDKLLPVLREIMESEPTCSYDLQKDDVNEMFFIPKMEWNVEDPEGRLRDIINGRAFPENIKIHNLRLYGSRKIEDYLENEEARTKTLSSNIPSEKTE